MGSIFLFNNIRVVRVIGTLIIFCLQVDDISGQYEYAATAEYPYGRVNPEAPKELTDFAPLIGKCHCQSYSRKQDKTWADPVKMTWTFKYIMNGMAVQDETLKEDGAHSGSIRQFVADSSMWYVHYYSTSSFPKVLPSWQGEKKEGKIVLYREQKAPNGYDGFYRLTFSEMTEQGFNWIGEWVDKSETYVYGTWKIICKKTLEP